MGAGPAIHLPIFDAGKLRADYSAATAGLDEAVASYNGALTKAIRETADALTQIRALNAQEQQQAKTLAAAKAGYDFAETRFTSGLTNQLTVIQAQSILLSERQAAATLNADRANARVALLMAIGGGFSPPSQIADLTNINADEQP